MKNRNYKSILSIILTVSIILNQVAPILPIYAEDMEQMLGPASYYVSFPVSGLNTHKVI